MKPRLLLFTCFALIPFLGSCNSTSYSVSKFSVTHDAGYELWDNFDDDNLKVVYDGTTLEAEQYTIDFSEFDTSKVGTAKIQVSLVKAPEVSLTLPIEVSHRRGGNVLFIGDDCNEDLLSFANELLAASDETLDFSLYAALLEKGSLDASYSAFAHDDAVYTFFSYDEEAKSWQKSEGLSLKNILNHADIDWDIVSLQQSVSCIGDSSGYQHLGSFLAAMTSFLEGSGKKVPSFSYHMPWAYQDGVSVDHDYYENYGNSEDAQFQDILKQTKEHVLPNNLFHFVLPSGSALQNARATSIETEREFTRDGKHLDDKGQYLVALDLAAQFTGYGASTFPYRGEEAAPRISEDEWDLFVSAVDSAIANPYALLLEEAA